MYLFFLALILHTAVSDLTATLLTTHDPTSLSLELRNTNPFSVALLRWNLPLDKRFGGEDNFIVLLNGQPVPYIGARVKYADPTFLDYLILASNETITVPIVLHNLYDFTKPGSYKIQFQSHVWDYVNEADFMRIPRARIYFAPSEIIASNAVIIRTNDPLLPQAVVPYPCSTSERNIILDAAASLRSPLIGGAVNVINQGNTATYREWFGAYVGSRWQIAEEVIRYIQQNTVVAYQCDDRAGVYAYVYPSDTTHTIYLCQAFWSANKIGGFDTQAGTLLHELSHFNNIGATGDHAYGTGACRNLAISSPARAVNNADSFEYFGESQFP